MMAAIEKSDDLSQLYTLIHIVARSRPAGAERLLQRHLGFADDPQVAALALHTLGVQWGCFGEVYEFTIAALNGLDWDPIGDVQDAAITVAGEFLRERSDCGLLERLITLTLDADKWTAVHRFNALARALGASQQDLAGLSARVDEWSRDAIETRALERLDRECS
ncbi:hypothetical protein [Myceligenerans xiligouense]|uniref:hypothetical protein n=1 Tax=Myceligenerans xiligouense TaxID=253184 RepID=UPI000F507744|nr:hypothetical protein [Myceligenerans xiligouense]